MKLSTVIMAHPARKVEAEELREALDRDVPVQYDPVAEPSRDPMQRWRNGRAAFEQIDPSSDWAMIIQDDAVVCKDLIAGLESALDALGPDGIVSPYTGRGRPDQANVRRAFKCAKDKGHSWMCTKSLCWGVAIVVPTHTIPDMLKWCSHSSKSKQAYDFRIGVYYRDVMKWRTWYTMPSLVDHRDEDSLVGNDGGPPRIAHEFSQGSALDIDWTQVPPGGLNPRH